MEQSDGAIGAPVYVAGSFVKRLRGLFAPIPDNAVLIIVPCSSIHTFGMKAEIDIAFFSYEGEVLDAHMGLRPWRVCRCPEAMGVVERFSRIDDGPDSWWSPGDRMTLGFKRNEEANDR